MTVQTDRDLEAEVAQIKAAHAAATRNLIKAEHQRDTALATAEAIRKQLLAEFEVSTTAEALKLAGTLDQELTHQIDQLKTALKEAGA